MEVKALTVGVFGTVVAAGFRALADALGVRA